jgi:hypothetical protein
MGDKEGHKYSQDERNILLGKFMLAFKDLKSAGFAESYSHGSELVIKIHSVNECESCEILILGKEDPDAISVVCSECRDLQEKNL